jgi:hypothetical protein
MVEGMDESEISVIANKVADVIKAELCCKDVRFENC